MRATEFRYPITYLVLVPKMGQVQFRSVMIVDSYFYYSNGLPKVIREVKMTVVLIPNQHFGAFNCFIEVSSENFYG